MRARLLLPLALAVLLVPTQAGAQPAPDKRPAPQISDLPHDAYLTDVGPTGVPNAALNVPAADIITAGLEATSVRQYVAQVEVQSTQHDPDVLLAVRGTIDRDGDGKEECTIYWFLPLGKAYAHQLCPGFTQTWFGSAVQVDQGVRYAAFSSAGGQLAGLNRDPVVNSLGAISCVKSNCVRTSYYDVATSFHSTDVSKPPPGD